MVEHDVKDVSLAGAGRLKIEWAEHHIDELTSQQESYLASWRHGT